MTNDQIRTMMDFLYSQRVPGLPATALADVFDRLIWCLADQGTSLLQVRESWLKSDEKERVEIALAMNETYPFNDAREMAVTFGRITDRWPEFRSRCAELSEARRKQRSDEQPAAPARQGPPQGQGT